MGMVCIFFFTIEEKFRHTFVSTVRGKDLTIKVFRESNDDAIKSGFTFKLSKHHWKSIEEEVRGWVGANWSKWEEEKPKWLDENMRARIPVEYIPNADAREKERRELTKDDQRNTREEVITATGTSEMKITTKKPKIDMDLSSLKAAVTRSKQDKEENTIAASRLQRNLLERGTVEGLLTNSTKEQQSTTQYAVISHSPPLNVMNYILSDSKVGIFRRHSTSATERQKNVIWELEMKGGIVIEFQLNLQICPTNDSTTIKIEPIKEENLSEEELKANIRTKRSLKASITGELRIAPFEYRQSAL